MEGRKEGRKEALTCCAWVVAAAALLAERATAQEPDYDCTLGEWSSPFMHEVSTPQATNPLANSQPWPSTHPAPYWQPMNMWHAVHMALIPKGPHQGHVLMWDHQFPGNVVQPYQRWAILDPDPAATTRFYNFFLPMPPTGGDLFCAGHAWTANGDLFVAGGTIVYPPPFQGGVLVYLFDPSRQNSYYNTAGEWMEQPAQRLVIPRWYPTVTLIHRFPEPATQIMKDCVLVTGGSEPSTPDRAQLTYEAYFVNMPPNSTLPSTVVRDTRNSPNWPAGVFDGPANPTANFFQYPRMFLLTNGAAFMAGMLSTGARVFHETTFGQWDYAAGVPNPNAFENGAPLNFMRSYQSSALLPLTPFAQDYVARVGGDPYVGASIKFAEYVNAKPTTGSTTWTTAPPMHVARRQGNLVLLPDGSQLMVGGETNTPTTFPSWVTTFAKKPELFKDNSWRQLAEETSPRDYHSTALLLPDGRVLSAGGESHTWSYQIFSPPYLSCGGTRPQNVVLQTPNGGAATFDSTRPAYLLTYNQQFIVQCSGLPVATTNLAKIVLTAPGSVTHHTDMHQRCIELASAVDPLQPGAHDRRLAQMPPNDKHAPRGYYMLWALTNHGVPSVATWIYIQ